MSDLSPFASTAERLAALTKEERDAILDGYTQAQLAALEWDWSFWGRTNQLPPPDINPETGKLWATWLVLAGRGFGKTRTGAEWVRTLMTGSTPLAPGQVRRMGIIAETAADARDVLVEGDSGILACHPPDMRPLYEPSKRRLTWPNGARALLFNGTEPDQLRGPQHDAAWVDELAKYRYAQETWDQLQFGLRTGDNPRVSVTTTPRPIPIIREIIKDPDTVITRGITADNFGNLSLKFIERVVKKYEGTRLGRQELNAELLDDIPGALWTREMLDRCRMASDTVLPRLIRIVVAVDPSGTAGDDDSSDDVGIVVAGKTDQASTPYIVLEDATVNLSPAGWGKRAVQMWEKWGAGAIIAEKNFGGAMVEHVIKTASKKANVKLVTASRGKMVRAEPVSALYEQGKVKHVGAFPELEDQLVLFRPDGYMGEGSPDRADALVWALTELDTGSGYSLANL